MVAVVLLTNLPGLIGLVHPNPISVTIRASSNFTRGFLPGTWFTDPDIGWTAQALGHRAALDWLHLSVPWWNPFEGLGSPLAAEMQSAAFFPPVILFAFSNGALWFHVFLELAAGLATYALVREVGLSRLAATAGGTLFGLNGTFSWLPHAPMNPVALLPLLLLGIERCYRRPERSSGWIIVAFALALSAYAGFPETAYLDTCMGVAWAVFRLAGSPRDRRARLFGLLCLGGLVGLLLALPIAIPFGEYLRQSFTGRHAHGVGYVFLQSVNLPTLGLPYLFGSIGALQSRIGSLAPYFKATGSYFSPIGGFVTVSSLVLAIAGVVGGRRERGLRIFLAVFTGTMIAWTFGVPPFGYLTTILPYMSHVDIARYSPPAWELGCVLLACFGLDSLRLESRSGSSPDDAERKNSRRVRLGVLAGCLGTLAIGAVTLGGTAGRLAHSLADIDSGARTYAEATIAWAVALVLLIGVLAMWRRRFVIVAVAALVIVDAVVMAGIPQLSAGRSYQLDLAPVAYLQAHLGDGRYFSFGIYHSDYGSYFGLAQLDETDLPVPSAFASEITSHLGTNSYPVHFDGTHVLNPSGPSPVAQALANIRAYEQLGVRYFLAPTRRHVFGRGRHLPDGLRRVFHDRDASIYALPHPVPYFSVEGGHCTLTPHGRDLVVATCASQATLVRSELDLAGWAATVNGRAAPILDADGLLSSVRLKPGRNVVAFSYAPPNIDIAVAGFLLGVILCLVLPLERRRRTRRRPMGLT